MIEGLKVTIGGIELRDLANSRAGHHETRCATYAEQIASMKAAQIEGMSYSNSSNGDPVTALEGRRTQHENDARELRFIASHINVQEIYLLDRDALTRLGIVASRY